MPMSCQKPKPPPPHLNDEDFKELVIAKSLALIHRGIRATLGNLHRMSVRLRDARCATVLDHLKRTEFIVNTPDMLERIPDGKRTKPEVLTDDQIRELILEAWDKDNIYPSHNNRKKIGVDCTDNQWYRARTRKWMSEHGITVRGKSCFCRSMERRPESPKRERPAQGTTAWFVEQYRSKWPNLWNILRRQKISSVDVMSESV